MWSNSYTSFYCERGTFYSCVICPATIFWVIGRYDTALPTADMAIAVSQRNLCMATAHNILKKWLDTVTHTVHCLHGILVLIVRGYPTMSKDWQLFNQPACEICFLRCLLPKDVFLRETPIQKLFPIKMIQNKNHWVGYSYWQKNLKILTSSIGQNERSKQDPIIFRHLYQLYARHPAETLHSRQGVDSSADRQSGLLCFKWECMKVKKSNHLDPSFPSTNRISLRVNNFWFVIEDKPLLRLLSC